MRLMNTWILTMKACLISAGVLFVVMGIKASFPAAVNEAPAVWSVVLTWMKPPYLYVVVNGIIVTILASSRFQQIHDSEPPVQGERRSISVRTAPPEDFEALSAEPEIKSVVEERKAAVVVYESGDRIVELQPVLVNGSRVDNLTENESRLDFDDDEVVDFSMESTSAVSRERIPPEFQLEYFPPANQKPPVSSKFHRRKPSRTTPEGAVPRKLGNHQTLESVWKMIMEARQESLASNEDDSPAAASSTLRQESSPSQEELNHRVEEFIKKINNDMRLQRQESLDRRIKKKIGAGAHL